MGKSPTASASVRVELERGTLQPGDVLHGTVYLSLPQPIEAATLKVRVLGRQGLNWLVATGNGMVARANRVEHLTEEIVLAEDAVFADGDSLYPFSLELPYDLQHNFVFFSRSVQDLQAVRVSVQYEVEAILSISRGRGSDVDARTSFRIEPLPMAVPFGRRVEVIKEEGIKFMGLFNRGTCSVALSIDTDVLDSSSTIEACVTLDLQTPLALKYISLVLYEKAGVDRHHQIFPGKTIGTRQVCCRRLDKAAVNLPSNGTTGSTELTIQLPLSPNEISDTDPLNPTMTSFFVDISYRVDLEVKFPMVPRITVGVPVTVIRKLVAPQELEVASVA